MVKALLIIGIFLFVSGIFSLISIDESVIYCFVNPCGILPNNYSQGIGQLIYFVFGTGLGLYSIFASYVLNKKKNKGKV